MTNLYDSNTADLIGEATPEQSEAGDRSAERDGGYGFFLIDAEGNPICAGTWEAQQPGVRSVYTI